MKVELGGVFGSLKHDVTGLAGLSDEEDDISGEFASDSLRDLRMPCRVL